MTKPLKSKGEIGSGQLIEKQLLAPKALPIGLRPARSGAASAALGKGCPPFAARRLPGRLHPPGGGPRVVSLPLCVTPCILFGASTRPTGCGNFGPATRGQGVRP